MIVGEIEKEKLETKFIKLDEETFKEIQINITPILSKEELIEKINSLEKVDKEYIKIILTGTRSFEINKYEILKYMENERIIKIKDQTQIAYPLEKMANENTLRGLFAKEMLEKLQKKDITQEQRKIIEKAIEIGIEALQ